MSLEMKYSVRGGQDEIVFEISGSVDRGGSRRSRQVFRLSGGFEKNSLGISGRGPIPSNHIQQARSALLENGRNRNRIGCCS